MSKPKDSESESPKERLAKYGADSLSIQELLAVLLFPGCRKDKAVKIVVNLLKTFDGNLINLFTATIHQLIQVKGIGFVKACQTKAVFELGNRIESYFEEMHPRIVSKNDVVKLLALHMRHLKQEEFRVVLLSSNKRLIRHERVSLGSLDAALVEPRDVFRPAIAANAKFIVIVHNHPSGDPTRSKRDALLTQQLRMCGVILGIEVLDHIVIGSSGYVSLKEDGLE